MLRGSAEEARYAFRVFGKNAGRTTAALTALALAIGFNTAVYSVADALVLRPLAIPEIEDTVFLYGHKMGDVDDRRAVSPVEFTRWRSGLKTLESIAAAKSAQSNLTGAGNAEAVEGKLVSAGFHGTLKVRPVLGRGFLPEEFTPGKDRVVLLAHSLWERRFGRDPAVVGQEVKLDGKSYRVIGVMPEHFHFPVPAEFWLPLAMTSEEWSDASRAFLQVFGRFRTGFTVEELRAELPVLTSSLRREFPGDFDGVAHGAEPLRNAISGRLTHDYTMVTVGCVCFLLVIACVNVANLQLAGLLSRGRELSVRAALGASRWRLVRQVLVESTLLALGGMLLGILVAHWCIDVVKAGMPPEVMRYLPGWRRMGLNSGVLLATAAATGVAALLSGLVPSLWLTGRPTAWALRDGGRGATTGPSRRRLSAVLVSSEIVLSLVLLVGAVLMSRSLQSIVQLPSGVNAGRLLTFRVTLPESRYPDPSDIRRFHERFRERISSLPGVAAAGHVYSLPFSGGGATATVRMEGRDYGRGPLPAARLQNCSPGFLKVFGLRLLKGRELAVSDGEPAPPVVVVNEAFARQVADTAEPVGRRFQYQGRWVTIVGIVENVTHDFTERGPRPAMFLAADQFPERGMDYLVSTSGDPLALVAGIRAALRELDPSQPIFQPRTIQKMVSDSTLGIAYVAAMLSVLGLVALFLATLGVYGMMSWSVDGRTREISVRMALGARPGAVAFLLLRRAALYALAGMTIGMIFSVALARLLSGLLFGISPTDSAALLGVPLILLAAVALASYPPARRAIRTDLIKGLQYE